MFNIFDIFFRRICLFVCPYRKKFNRLIDGSLFNKPSLTQLSQHEPETSKAIPSSTQSYVSPTQQSRNTSEIHNPTSQLYVSSMSSKTGSATNQVTFSAEPQIPRIADTETKIPKTSHSSNRLR